MLYCCCAVQHNICSLYCSALLYTDSQAPFHPTKTRAFPLSTYPLQLQCHCVYGQDKYVLKHLLNPWSRVLLEKPISTQPVKKFPAFMEPEGSLPCSQKPATCPCPETDQSSLWPPSHFLRTHLNIILPSMPGSSKWSLSLRFPLQKPCKQLSSPSYMLHAPLISFFSICSPK